MTIAFLLNNLAVEDIQSAIDSILQCISTQFLLRDGHTTLFVLFTCMWMLETGNGSSCKEASHFNVWWTLTNLRIRITEM